MIIGELLTYWMTYPHPMRRGHLRTWDQPNEVLKRPHLIEWWWAIRWDGSFLFRGSHRPPMIWGLLVRQSYHIEWNDCPTKIFLVKKKSLSTFTGFRPSMSSSMRRDDASIVASNYLQKIIEICKIMTIWANLITKQWKLD